MYKNDDIIRGMSVIMPVLKPFRKLPFLKKIAQKILIFEKHNRILSADLSAGRFYFIVNLTFNQEMLIEC